MVTENITCPWCYRGALIAEGTGKVRISCRCHECGKFFKVDFQTMTATRGVALKRTTLGGATRLKRSS